MKKTDLSNVEANVRGLILEDKTLQHIFEAYQEGFEAILKALNCDPAEITILSGAVVDDSADPDFTVTAGWAAYQGEVFQVDAGAFTAGGGETAVWVIETTYAATDPVQFDDGNEFNINQIRKLKLESGVSGSGEKDWGDVQFIQRESELNYVVDTGIVTGIVKVVIIGSSAYVTGLLTATGSSQIQLTIPEFAIPSDGFVLIYSRSSSGLTHKNVPGGSGDQILTITFSDETLRVNHSYLLL